MIKKIFPTSAFLMLTDDCNLACTYCFEKDIRNHTKMDLKTAKKTVDFLVSNAKETNSKEIKITFFGGEPTLNVKVMVSILNHAKEITKNTNIVPKFSIITNATIFNDEIKEFYLLWYNLYGALDIQLSIDGAPETQNSGRITKDGSGSSDLVEKTVKQYVDFLTENKINREKSMYIHACITKNSLPILKDNYTYLCNLIGTNKVSFMPVMEEDWSDEDCNIIYDQVKQMGDHVIAHCKNKNQNNFFDTSLFFKNPFKRKPEFGCSAADRLISIGTRGEIYPCHRFYSYSVRSGRSFIVGNIKTGVEEDLIKEFQNIPISEMSSDIKCKDCPSSSCKICKATNLETSGDMRKISPLYCKLSLSIDKAIKEVFEKANIVLSRDTNNSNKDSMDITIKILEKMNEKIESMEADIMILKSKQAEEVDFLKDEIVFLKDLVTKLLK